MPSSGKEARILLVEEDRKRAAFLEHVLQRAGFTTLAVETAADALAVSHWARFDLVLLDLALPDGDARAVCDELHGECGVPVVMLAESLGAADRDAWLDGAEDYVVKPARAADVVARIRAVLRRTRELAAPGVLEVGPLRVDPARGRAELDGMLLRLSPKELQLLIRLMRDAGTVVRREHLMEDVWGPGWFGSRKTLDVHIGWLRRKLGDDPADPRLIRNVRGIGYRFTSGADLEPALPPSAVQG
jgi:two-component system response regulator RegX3